ncbi:Sulfotransferase [Halocaridina rubra]|uniref:Sulfotransferase n=1 Tax=Halocaridina rubra TaxID=373956 RepID=A0AAN9A9C9_HALRR
MRICGKMWPGLTASRERRILVCLGLLCLLLTVQIYTQRTSTETTGVEGQDGQRFQFVERRQQLLQNQNSNEPDVIAEAVTPEATTRVRDTKVTTKNKVKDDILKGLSSLDTKQLQKLWRMLDSTRDPHAVQLIRIDQALQALKVRLLEDVSGRRFPEIMDAVQKASPISSQPRPESMQVIISTTWRSGSTFLEELLASHPAVYNHYEPLMQFGLKQIRDGADSVHAQKLIHDLLSCKYQGQNDYISTALKITDMFSRNAVLWESCSSEDWGNALCYNDVFLEGACKLFPWTTMKLVRLRLKLLRPILEEKTFNAHIIYLVRDPRGVINSRTDTVKWCSSADCNDPSYLCQDMDDDLTVALQMRKDFPGRVYVLRYEDLALDPFPKTQDLLAFLGLDFDPKMEEFLRSHTTKNYDKPWSTSRESKTRVTHWVSKLPEDKVLSVQNSCTAVLNRFGYLPINSTKSVSVEHILGPLVLPES